MRVVVVDVDCIAVVPLLEVAPVVGDEGLDIPFAITATPQDLEETVYVSDLPTGMTLLSAGTHHCLSARHAARAGGHAGQDGGGARVRRG